MRGLSYLLVVTCVGVAVAVPPSNPSAVPSSGIDEEQPDDLSKVLMKREYHDPNYSSKQTDNGYYYYYHPVEERTLDADKKDTCGPILKVLIPIIIITIFAGILAANSVGLVPNFQLPPIQIPLNQLPLNLNLDQNLADKINTINAGLNNVGKRKRSLAEDEADVPGSENAHPYQENVSSWNGFNKLTNFVLDAIETDDCTSRLVCESGKYAEGRSLFLSLLEFITPPIYEERVKIFKDSALNKSNCRAFRCGYVDDNFL